MSTTASFTNLVVRSFGGHYKASTLWETSMAGWSPSVTKVHKTNDTYGMVLDYDPFVMDRDASRWFNSSYTKHDRLLWAICFFVTTGWGEDRLEDFIKGIQPPSGWEEDGAVRRSGEYSHAVKAMMGGYHTKGMAND